MENKEIRNVIEGYHKANFGYENYDFEKALTPVGISLGATETEDGFEVEIIANIMDRQIELWSGQKACRVIKYETVDELLTFISNATFEEFVEMVDATDDEFENLWGGKVSCSFVEWTRNVDVQSWIGAVEYRYHFYEDNVFIYSGKNCYAELILVEKRKNRADLKMSPFCSIADEEDLKKKLGIAGHSSRNEFDLGKTTTFTLNKAHPDSARLAKWLVQAKWEEDMIIRFTSLSDAVDE